MARRRGPETASRSQAAGGGVAAEDGTGLADAHDGASSGDSRRPPASRPNASSADEQGHERRREPREPQVDADLAPRRPPPASRRGPGPAGRRRRAPARPGGRTSPRAAPRRRAGQAWSSSRRRRLDQPREPAADARGGHPEMSGDLVRVEAADEPKGEEHPVVGAESGRAGARDPGPRRESRGRGRTATRGRG